MSAETVTPNDSMRDFLNKLKDPKFFESELSKIRSPDRTQYTEACKLLGIEFREITLIIYAHIHKYYKKYPKDRYKIISETHGNSDQEVFEEAINYGLSVGIGSEENGVL